MSKINYQELREAAEQATQDEWVAYIMPEHNGIYPAHTSEGRHCGYFIDWPGIDGQRKAGANARYIAAIPPKVALALLDEVKRLEDTNIDAMCRILELETNLVALVAENAGLKEVINEVRSIVANSHGVSGWHQNGDIAEWDEVLPEIDSVETPATDTFLAEVRAQGVEMFSECAYTLEHHDHAVAFAAELRKGA